MNDPAPELGEAIKTSQASVKAVSQRYANAVRAFNGEELETVAPWTPPPDVDYAHHQRVYDQRLREVVARLWDEYVPDPRLTFNDHGVFIP